MTKIFQYIALTFFLPFWYLQKLVIREKNIWIFGAWTGERFSDNSKYLYEHVSKSKENIKAVWLTNNVKVLTSLNDEGLECYLANSFKGLYYSLKAKYVFVSCEKKDVNHLFINGAVLIHLWHGNPLKKIGLDDKYSAVNGFLYSKIVRRLFPMAYEFNYNYMVSNSSLFTPLMQSSYRLAKEQILETGCPRNDIFFADKQDSFNLALRELFPKSKIVYYLPTFRNSSVAKNIFTQDDYDEGKLEAFLTLENMVIVNKGHFVESKNGVAKSNKTSRIIHLKDSDVASDINVMLKDADGLITDYSSAFFDFLLTERPIIFAAFDLQEYMSKSRELYFNYEDAIAGPIATNWAAIFFQLKHIWDNKENKVILQEKNRLYNKYHDANNSQRVMKAVIEISKKS